MPTYRNRLPQLDAPVFLTDGGIETTLVFDDGFELPDFAAFTLLDDARRARRARPLLRLVRGDRRPRRRRHRAGDARPGEPIRTGARARASSVEAARRDQRRRGRPARRTRAATRDRRRAGGDQRLHRSTRRRLPGRRDDDRRRGARVPRRAGAGVRRDRGRPGHRDHDDVRRGGDRRRARPRGPPGCRSCCRSPWRPTGGCRPDSHSATRSRPSTPRPTRYPAYYMVNCAHPTHFRHVLDGSPAWAARLGGVRANASRLSHAELDEAETLDSGDPVDLAARYRGPARRSCPTLRVLGGCCGTDHRHIDAISRLCA